MDVKVLISQVVVLFLVLVFGFIARKNNVITGDMTEKLSDIILRLTLPLLIISSYNLDLSTEMLRNAGLAFIIS